MKKILISLIILSLAITLISCGENGDGKYHASVFYYTFSDTYMASVRAELDKALDQSGIAHQNYDSNSNQTTQNEQIDTAISKGTDLLIVNIVTSGSVDASSAIVEKARAANIPVIFFNRAIEDDASEGVVLDSYEQCAFVGTDAAEAGHLQGKIIGDYLLNNFEKTDLNNDGKISYAMFMGQLGNAESIYRTKFSVEDADKMLKDAGKEPLYYFDQSNPNRYQVDQDGNWSATAANNYMTTNLTQYNETNNNMIELIICNNDAMAEGAISALNDKGYNLGGDKYIPVFGVDATSAAKQLIKENKMTGTVNQDAQGMARCVAYLAQNGMAGKALTDATDEFKISTVIPNKIYIPYTSYTGI